MTTTAKLVLSLACCTMAALSAYALRPQTPPATPTPPPPKVVKTEAEWKAILTPEAYHITREAGTEPPFRNAYWNNHDTGEYHCVACQAVLFDSKSKFESGTGWPSFFQAISKDSVKLVEDKSLLDTRTEVRCSKCDSHLGHVFGDGPQPTGLRYCMNSGAMKFEKDKPATPKKPDSAKPK